MKKKEYNFTNPIKMYPKNVLRSNPSIMQPKTKIPHNRTHKCKDMTQIVVAMLPTSSAAETSLRMSSPVSISSSTSEKTGNKKAAQ